MGCIITQNLRYIDIDWFPLLIIVYVLILGPWTFLSVLTFLWSRTQPTFQRNRANRALFPLKNRAHVSGSIFHCLLRTMSIVSLQCFLVSPIDSSLDLVLTRFGTICSHDHVGVGVDRLDFGGSRIPDGATQCLSLCIHTFVVFLAI